MVEKTTVQDIRNQDQEECDLRRTTLIKFLCKFVPEILPLTKEYKLNDQD